MFTLNFSPGRAHSNKTFSILHLIFIESERRSLLSLNLSVLQAKNKIIASRGHRRRKGELIQHFITKLIFFLSGDFEYLSKFQIRTELRSRTNLIQLRKSKSFKNKGLIDCCF